MIIIITTSQPRQAKAQPLITPISETGSETGPLVCINQCQACEAAISFEATFVVSGGIKSHKRLEDKVMWQHQFR
jgi:hypothetical protein